MRRQVYSANLTGQADIVQASAYPSDINFWQAGKALARGTRYRVSESFLCAFAPFARENFPHKGPSDASLLISLLHREERSAYFSCKARLMLPGGVQTSRGGSPSLQLAQ